MRKILITTLVGAILCPMISVFGQHQPPVFEWATRIEATNTYGWSIGLDLNGNPVLAGMTRSAINLGSTNIPNTEPLSSTGMAIKMTGGGTFYSGIGITGGAMATGVDPTSLDLLLCGSVERDGEADFGEITLSPANSTYGFIASYDANNNINWTLSAVPAGSFFECTFADVQLIDGGDTLGFGTFNGASVDIEGSTIQKHPNSRPSAHDLFLLNTDSQGDVNWVTHYGGSEDDYAESLAIDGAGNIIIAGHFYSPELVFGETTLTNQGDFDVFLAKLDPLGNPLWAKSIATADTDFCRSMAIDSVSNNVYLSAITNAFSGQQMVIQKFSSDGDLLWEFDATGEAPGSQARGIAVDSDGNCFACGDSGIGSVIWKIGADGKMIWRKDAESGTPLETTLESMVIAPNQSVFITGYSRSQEIDLDGISIHGTGIEYRDPTTFVAKLSADPPTIKHQLSSNNLILSWPTNQAGFQLEANSLNLNPEGWAPISTDLDGGRNVVTNAPTGAGQVFRLRKTFSIP